MDTSMFELNNTDTASSKRYIDTASRDIRQNFLYVQETGFLKSTGANTSHREKMNSYLIIYVLEGEGFFTYNEKCSKVYPGAVFYIDCQNPYTHASSEDNPWELLWVHFNGASARKYYNIFTNTSENIFYPLNGLEIAEEIKQIMKTTKNKNRYYDLTNNALITHLLTALITCQKQHDRHSSRHISTEQKLEEIQAYLQKNYMKPCSLDDLSNKFYVSKFYLSREFKQRFGEGISSYVANLRINRAKKLLRFTTMSTGEIASICGINDSNHFLKVFKKIEGMTPTEFRKKWKES